MYCLHKYQTSKTLKMLLCLLALFCSLLFSAVLNVNAEGNETSDVSDVSDYNADKVYESCFWEITDLDQLNDSLDKFVYFGRPTCAFCEEYEQAVKIAGYDSRQVIYYFNTDSWRDNPDFESILNSYHVSAVPALIYRSKDKVKICDVNQDLFEQSPSEAIGGIGSFIHQNKKWSFFYLKNMIQNLIVGVTGILVILSIFTAMSHHSIDKYTFVSNIVVCISLNVIILLLEYRMAVYVDDYGLSHWNDPLNTTIIPLIQAGLALICIVLQFKNIKNGGNKKSPVVHTNSI